MGDANGFGAATSRETDGSSLLSRRCRPCALGDEIDDGRDGYDSVIFEEQEKIQMKKRPRALGDAVHEAIEYDANEGGRKVVVLTPTKQVYRDPNVLKRIYDEYVFDFDNVLSSCLLGTKQQLHDELGRKLPVKDNVDDVTVDDFGGEERVLLLEKLFSQLTQSGKRFCILSKGQHHRIVKSLKNVGLLRFFATEDKNEDRVAVGRIYARGSVPTLNGVTKGEMISNLRSRNILFIDDTFSNLEEAGLALENSPDKILTLYQPAAGPHSTGLSESEIESLLLMGQYDHITGVRARPVLSPGNGRAFYKNGLYQKPQLEDEELNVAQSPFTPEDSLKLEAFHKQWE